MAAIIHRADLLEEAVVHRNGVVVDRQTGIYLSLKRLNLLVRVGRGDHTKDRGNARKQLTGVIVGKDDILERRLIDIIDNSRNLLVLQRHTALEGGAVVFGHDAIEGRNAVWRLPHGLEEGIVANFFALAARGNTENYHHKCE